MNWMVSSSGWPTTLLVRRRLGVRTKVTEVQLEVLLGLLRSGGRVVSPRGSLERLEKKGLVEGGRREGWALTPKGLHWLGALHVGQ